MPPKGRKRKSNQLVASETQDAPDMTSQKIATDFNESPNKRRKMGVSIAQKQALIDNLQLEVTERARKLRAQYNLQAQGLRTRIEIRINRIPMALRKAKMGDLLLKYASQKQVPPKQAMAVMAGRAPPPVPEKDFHLAQSSGRGPSSPMVSHAGPGRPRKRLSDDIAAGDKENQTAHLENPKKRQRGNPHAAAYGTQVPTQVLSPASSNARLNPRDRERGAPAPSSPVKSFIARPVSPAKQAAATSLLSSMVEKARSTRAATARKPTTSSTASAAAGRTTAARTRRGAAATTAAASRSAAAATARAARRVSGTSEASDGSTATVVRKNGRATAATAATAAKKTAATTRAASTTKKSVMSSIKKGVASATSKKTAASKTATASTASAATTRSGRVLRRRD